AHLVTAVEAHAAEGTPRPLAQRIVSLDRVAEVFEIGHIAADLTVPSGVVADLYHRVGEVVDLDWLRRRLAELPAEDRWERRAVEGLSEGLLYARRQLAHDTLLCHEDGGEVEACLRVYTEAHREELEKLRALINDIKSAPRTTL